jgi:hypothetical protein
MGSGHWSTDVYASNSTLRAATGKSAFDYSDTMHTRAVEDRVTHQTLNPLDVEFREARDNDDHPLSVPVAVMFDVTGSMKDVPRHMQETLPDLVDSLRLKGFVEDGQILFGGIGDAYTDAAPLQVGQFEADNRVEDHLGNMWLEGHGGGQNPPQESYELALYFFARHVVTDHWDKRGKKGYLFLTGDERAYPQVDAKQVRRVIGDDLDESIATEAIVREVQERWHLFFVIPAETAHAGDKDMRAHWENLIGTENVLDLPNPKGLADLVASAVGANEEAERNSAP